MALWVVARTGGSRWVQAPLTDSGQTSVGGWGSAKRSGASPSQPASAMPPHKPQGILRIRRNQPLQSMAADFVASTGGSKCVQAQPARRQQVRAGSACRPQPARCRSTRSIR